MPLPTLLPPYSCSCTSYWLRYTMLVMSVLQSSKEGCHMPKKPRTESDDYKLRRRTLHPASIVLDNGTTSPLVHLHEQEIPVLRCSMPSHPSPKDMVWVDRYGMRDTSRAEPVTGPKGALRQPLLEDFLGHLYAISCLSYHELLSSICSQTDQYNTIWIIPHRKSRGSRV